MRVTSLIIVACSAFHLRTKQPAAEDLSDQQQGQDDSQDEVVVQNFQAADQSAQVQQASTSQQGSVAAPWQVTFDVQLDQNTASSFTVAVHPEWAPLGAQRFKELVDTHFLDNSCFFRVVPNFMAQFGLAADPSVTAKWQGSDLKDDPTKVSNTRGRLTFANAGPDTRTTQMFVNFKDNSFLDNQHFAPFAEVVSGMDVVDRIYSGYGEGAPSGNGPDQGRVSAEGQSYLSQSFPALSCIKSVHA
mmetsp:Transcript_32244/g.70630  ORF Transcript_32244/g.70630 Transcript_32244/m.70630 type:complete len:245 (+) Transcript_32244:75-809(+)|eukprot:CAMPEP_0204271350 /NCGR_PEP_ID=MMETSP0468-20130131/19605_1 /ASSEMBLY_ACC=CAM_ASM_000383 /TAXON_ID=2969 /ORGANISM="Oxyrrhis marina" /LENGTH=244 /DNA_ID=CAMNT_0051246999 /DNA_START=69 /DNA_END=803 /DNA_ORIENTATION=+